MVPVTQRLTHAVGQNQHEINFIFKIHSIPISRFLLSARIAQFNNNFMQCVLKAINKAVFLAGVLFLPNNRQCQPKLLFTNRSNENYDQIVLRSIDSKYVYI